MALVTPRRPGREDPARAKHRVRLTRTAPVNEDYLAIPPASSAPVCPPAPRVAPVPPGEVEGGVEVPEPRMPSVVPARPWPAAALPV